MESAAPRILIDTIRDQPDDQHQGDQGKWHRHQDVGASLLSRTEGWAAGLRLAALSPAGRADPERFVAEFSGSERTVADYLIAEVLKREPEPVGALHLLTGAVPFGSGNDTGNDFGQSPMRGIRRSRGGGPIEQLSLWSAIPARPRVPSPSIERRHVPLIRLAKAALSTLVVGALVAGCSSQASSAPTAAASPSAAASAAAPSAAAPSAAAPSANPSVAPSMSNVTLEVLASQDWIKSSEQVLAGKFEAQTGIHLDFQIIPSDQYFNVLTTKLQSGQGVDLFLGQAGVSDMQLTYNAPVNAVDLSNEPWVSTLDPVVAAQSTVNNKLYGAEVWDVVGANYWVMSYNKSIFAKYNLSVPTTFADFESVCATLLQNGITPIYEPVSDGWHHVLWFPSIGGQMEALEPGLYAKLNANQTTFAADANAMTAVTQLNDLYQKGYFGKSALSSKEADTSKQMASGKYAMTLSEISRGTQIASAFPTFQATDFGYFPDPILDNQLQPVHPAGPTWMIDTKSQHVAEAKEWLDFMMQPDNLQWLIDNTPDFETLPFTGVKAKWDASQQAFFDTYKEASVPVLQDGVNYVNPQWMLMGQDFVSMFTGKAPPQKVLQLIDTERTKEAKTAKDPSWP